MDINTYNMNAESEFEPSPFLINESNLDIAFLKESKKTVDSTDIQNTKVRKPIDVTFN